MRIVSPARARKLRQRGEKVIRKMEQLTDEETGRIKQVVTHTYYPKQPLTIFTAQPDLQE